MSELSFFSGHFNLRSWSYCTPVRRNYYCYFLYLIVLFSFSTGLYHGKDVRSGNSISHSHTRSKRKWYPNVQNKRVWSETLDDWVRFKMTTCAMKKIDDYGGIDNYIMSLDEPSVQDSKYITKMRGIIASSMFHQGMLSEKLMRKMQYHKTPPPPPVTTSETSP